VSSGCGLSSGWCRCDDERVGLPGLRCRGWRRAPGGPPLGEARVPRGAAVPDRAMPAGSLLHDSSSTGWPRSSRLPRPSSPRSWATCQWCTNQAPKSANRAPRNALDDLVGAQPADDRADEGPDADHQQVEGARHELGDHQHEAGDEPQQPKFQFRLLARAPRGDDAVLTPAHRGRRRTVHARSSCSDSRPRPARPPPEATSRRIFDPNLHPQDPSADGDGILGERDDLGALAEAVHTSTFSGMSRSDL